MSEKFQRPFEREKVKDKWKLVKRIFTKCHAFSRAWAVLLGTQTHINGMLNLKFGKH